MCPSRACLQAMHVCPWGSLRLLLAEQREQPRMVYAVVVLLQAPRRWRDAVVCGQAGLVLHVRAGVSHLLTAPYGTACAICAAAGSMGSAWHCCAQAG